MVGAIYNSVNNKKHIILNDISHYAYHYHDIIITTLKHGKVNDSPKVTQQYPCL